MSREFLAIFLNARLTREPAHSTPHGRPIIGCATRPWRQTHGTAPKYANKDKVNPGSVILSGEMMFRYMGWTEMADLILKGLNGALADFPSRTLRLGAASTSSPQDEVIRWRTGLTTVATGLRPVDCETVFTPRKTAHRTVATAATALFNPPSRTPLVCTKKSGCSSEQPLLILITGEREFLPLDHALH
jgi:hypothetical protein